MILTKEYRLVWDSEIVLYGQFNLDTKTETLKDAYECDTQQELDDKVISLGFEIPADLPCVDGCTNPTACNYNPLATCDDGSCYGLLGCTNPLASNYNSAATCDDGSCAN